MLFWVGHCSAGHNKAEVVVVMMITEPPQAPQDKGSVAAKHTPVACPKVKEGKPMLLTI